LGRRGVAGEAPDNSDKDLFAARAARHVRDAYHGVLLNVVVLDLA
jgi:hypothetical protein